MSELVTIKASSKFKKKIDLFLGDERSIGADAAEFIFELRRYTEIYLIGGAIRNLYADEPVRDLDLMLVESLETNQAILDLLPKDSIKNRMGGYKIQFTKMEIDLWSLEKNWATETGVVKEKQVVTKVIALGTFLNFDSLVYALNSRALNVDNFNRCVYFNTLDIVKHGKDYISQNPMGPAIVLRVIFLKMKYNFQISIQLKRYLSAQLKLIENNYTDAFSYLQSVLAKYPKYQSLLNGEKLSSEIKALQL